MKRWSICYFTCCAVMLIFVYGYGWHHYHQDCIALYGVGSSHDDVELFIACVQENMAAAYGAQFVAILLIPVMMLLASIGEKIWNCIIWWRESAGAVQEDKP